MRHSFSQSMQSRPIIFRRNSFRQQFSLSRDCSGCLPCNHKIFLKKQHCRKQLCKEKTCEKRHEKAACSNTQTGKTRIGQTAKILFCVNADGPSARQFAKQPAVLQARTPPPADCCSVLLGSHCTRLFSRFFCSILLPTIPAVFPMIQLISTNKPNQTVTATGIPQYTRFWRSNFRLFCRQAERIRLFFFRLSVFQPRSAMRLMQSSSMRAQNMLLFPQALFC